MAFLPLFCILALNFSGVLGIGGSIQAVGIIIAAVAFVAIHGIATLGVRNLAAFLILTVAISFAAETIGVATGLIFGHYHYTGNLGMKILGVPPLIQFAYVSMGYASMMMARLLVGAVRTFDLRAVLVATMLMVGWDVSMDPYQSTVSGDWIWEHGGAYFGVPAQNYAGWFLTVLVFMFAYWIFARRFADQPRRSEPIMNMQPVLLYALFALNVIVTPITGGLLGPFASPAGGSLNAAILGPSMTLIALFVMGTPVVIALARRTV